MSEKPPFTPNSEKLFETDGFVYSETELTRAAIEMLEHPIICQILLEEDTYGKRVLSDKKVSDLIRDFILTQRE